MNVFTSVQFPVLYQRQIDGHSVASGRVLLLGTPQPVFCAACHSTRDTVVQDRTLGIGNVCCMLEDEEPACDCVRIDVDVDDARSCPVHGPHSEFARRCRAREAEAIAAYYAGSDGADCSF